MRVDPVYRTGPFGSANAGADRDRLVIGPSAPVRVIASSVAEVEMWRLGAREAVDGIQASDRLIVTLAGLAGYRDGRHNDVADANTMRFATGGQSYRLHTPSRDVGHVSLSIRPTVGVLRAVCGGGESGRHPAFTSGARFVTAALKLLVQQIVRMPAHCHDLLETDELVLDLLRTSLGDARPRPVRNSPLVRRAKELLHDGPKDVMQSLEAIATRLEVHGAYLTQEFTRSEGVPLSRYQRQLRLGEALHALPECEDITALALELGFSSHSHFTFAFRKEFGLTPSDFRDGGPRRTVYRLAS